MLKTHQATIKRFRFTKLGKVIKKKAGQSHFNAKETGSTVRMKRRPTKMAKEYERTIKSLTPFS